MSNKKPTSQSTAMRTTATVPIAPTVIYELRASIGTTAYHATYTNVQAANARAAKLRSVCKEAKVKFAAIITPLIANEAGEFEPVADETLFTESYNIKANSAL